MGSKINDELVSTVRSIVGPDFSSMDVIRALHLAKNDATAAINIIYDTPSFGTRDKPPIPHNSDVPTCSASTSKRVRNEDEPCTRTPSNNAVETSSPCSTTSIGAEWLLVGSAELPGLSTSKGRRVKPGDEVVFTFPSAYASKTPSSAKVFGKGRHMANFSEIVRFSTKDSGEIGRIPNEWARCLLPLVRDKKVRIEGLCKSAPEVLSLMDTVLLSISVYINSSLLRKHQQTSLKAASNAAAESVIHPLPNLFWLLGLTAFKKAEFTPEDLSGRKRPLDLKVSYSMPSSLARTLKNCSQNDNETENEESISDIDLETIVGAGDTSELEEMDPPGTLLCELRPYQKQALHWMIHLEKGKCMDEAATTLHPCWEGYHLADKRELVIYLNAFSGDATTEFPSTLQIARGGVNS